MSYQGLGYIVVLGVAIGTAIYYYFNSETNRPHGYGDSSNPRPCRSCNRDDNCTICLESLDNVRRLRSLRCGHSFHRDCIGLWLRQRNMCPVCRMTV